MTLACRFVVSLTRRLVDLLTGRLVDVDVLVDVRSSACRLAVLSAFSFLMALPLNAQTNEASVASLARHALRFNQVLPQENVYLHFDNTGYFIGETMWFKAYVTSSDSNRWTRKSRILYVELVNPSGSVIKTQKMEIKDGQARGQFSLKDLLISGFYEVRAYTRYMTNWGRDVVFSRLFPIFNAPTRKFNFSNPTMTSYEGIYRLPDYREDDEADDNTVEQAKRAKLHVQFYPEGGHLVKGLKSRVAFDVVKLTGEHAPVTGHLEVGGQTLCEVLTIREGRGVFEYTPEENASDNDKDGGARLVLTDENGKTTSVALPDAVAVGCVMNVNTMNDDRVEVSLQASPQLEGRKLGIVISYHGRTEICDSVVVGSTPMNLSIAKSGLEQGINEITLFDVSGQILADRLFFVYPRTLASQIDVKIGNQVLTPYKPINLSITTPRPSTTFSLSVRDAGNEVNGTSMDAATWLLLGSDLKGFVENPYYYLESDDNAHRQAADLLTMVQGWRKYDFEMMDGLHPIHLKQPTETGLLLMGQLHKYKKKDEVGGSDLLVTLYSKEKDILAGGAKTDEKGYYCFQLPDCWGTWDLVMQPRKDDKPMKYYIGINRNFSPSTRRLSFAETIALPVDTPRVLLSEKIEEDEPMDMLADVQYIDEVVVKAKRMGNAATTWRSEQHGAYNAQQHYDCVAAADDYIDKGLPMPTLIEWLKIKNPFINGNDNLSGESNPMQTADKWLADGPAYRNRPILWFVDNRLMFGTGMPSRYTQQTDSAEATAVPDYDIGEFPVFLDEVKSVYVAERDSKAQTVDVKRSGESYETDLMGLNYVAIYVYTITQYSQKEPTGIRRTQFEGYSIPATFVAPDYTVLPQADDYRRTLYWNPDVTTDESGHATISFDNSATCRQIILSAEAITSDGQVLMY